MAKYHMTKRKLSAQATKNIIYESALNLFRLRGYDAVTVEDITQKANVAKGTFYTYFKSKDAVLTYAFKEIDIFYKEAINAAGENISAGEQFIILGNTMCKYVSESFGINFTKIVYQNQISLGKKTMILNNRGRELFKILMKIAKKGHKTGEFNSNLTDEEIVLLLARSLYALLYDWCLYDGNFNLIKEGKKYFKLILSIVR